MSHKEKLVCPKCGSDTWSNVDNPKEYIKFCSNYSSCEYKIVYKKSDFINKFHCPKCGGLIGSLEENDDYIGVRCNHCDELTIVLEKHDDDLKNYKDPIAIANSKGLPVCPKCGSTAITTGARGVNWKLGLIGASKTVNRCANCGHTWKPKG